MARVIYTILEPLVEGELAEITLNNCNMNEGLPVLRDQGSGRWIFTRTFA